MSTRYPQGKKVHVEFDGIIDANSEHDGWVVVKNTASGWVHKIYPGDTAAITLAEPAYWPPKLGDVWDADGMHWVVYSEMTNNAHTLLITKNCVIHNAEVFLKRYPDAVRVLSGAR